MYYLTKFWDWLWGVKTPEQYFAWLKKRYKDNSELEFKDNY